MTTENDGEEVVEEKNECYLLSWQSATLRANVGIADL